jgi:hypothetical protein
VPPGRGLDRLVGARGENAGATLLDQVLVHLEREQDTASDLHQALNDMLARRSPDLTLLGEGAPRLTHCCYASCNGLEGLFYRVYHLPDTASDCRTEARAFCHWFGLSLAAALVPTQCPGTLVLP